MKPSLFLLPVFLFFSTWMCAQKGRIIQFWVEPGIQLSNTSVFHPNTPDFGFSAAGTIHFSKIKAGIRYRKEFWYLLGKSKKESIRIYQNLPYASIEYYEETLLEAYKDFPLKKIQWLRIGAGYGWVFPYYFNRPHYEPLKQSVFFITIPYRAAQITLRTEIPLLGTDDPYLNYTTLKRGAWELGVSFVFPRKYYDD